MDLIVKKFIALKVEMMMLSVAHGEDHNSIAQVTCPCIDLPPTKVQSHINLHHQNQALKIKCCNETCMFFKLK